MSPVGPAWRHAELVNCPESSHQVGVRSHQLRQARVHGGRCHLIQHAIHTCIHHVRAARCSGEDARLPGAAGAQQQQPLQLPCTASERHASHARNRHSPPVTKQVRPVTQQCRQCSKVVCHQGQPVGIRVAADALRPERWWRQQAGHVGTQQGMHILTSSTCLQHPRRACAAHSAAQKRAPLACSMARTKLALRAMRETTARTGAGRR